MCVPKHVSPLVVAAILARYPGAVYGSLIQYMISVAAYTQNRGAPAIADQGCRSVVAGCGLGAPDYTGGLHGRAGECDAKYQNTEAKHGRMAEHVEHAVHLKALSQLRLIHEQLEHRA